MNEKTVINLFIGMIKVFISVSLAFLWYGATDLGQAVIFGIFILFILLSFSLVEIRKDESPKHKPKGKAPPPPPISKFKKGDKVCGAYMRPKSDKAGRFYHNSS